MYGCVLDWDFDKKLVVVSLTPELVAERKAVEAHKGKQKKVELFKVVLTKCKKSQGSRRMLCEISYTAVTCVVTQHSLQVLLKIREGFAGLFYFILFCFFSSLIFLTFLFLQLRSGRIIDACVQLIKANYIVVTLPRHNYRLAYAPTKLVRILLCCESCSMNVLLKKKVRFIGQSRQSCQARTSVFVWCHTRGRGLIKKEADEPSLNFFLCCKRFRLLSPQT